jgi:uncharacterized metal-binding protein YceD (DUF177 family)
MSAPEFCRKLDVRQCQGRLFALVATAKECAALAKRLDVVRIDRLEANLSLARDGDLVTAQGRLEADLIQTCALSAEELHTRVAEPLTLRFIPAVANPVPEADIEIDSDSEDEIEYSGVEIDLGEAVAQSLALAIDPFATGPSAEAARAALAAERDSPFAALAALKRSADTPDA